MIVIQNDMHRDALSFMIDIICFFLIYYKACMYYEVLVAEPSFCISIKVFIYIHKEKTKKIINIYNNLSNIILQAIKDIY